MLRQTGLHKVLYFITLNLVFSYLTASSRQACLYAQADRFVFLWFGVKKTVLGVDSIFHSFRSDSNSKSQLFSYETNSQDIQPVAKINIVIVRPVIEL